MKWQHWISLKPDWVRPPPRRGFKSVNQIYRGRGSRMWPLFKLGLLSPLTSACKRKYICTVKTTTNYLLLYCGQVVLVSYCHKQKVKSVQNEKKNQNVLCWGLNRDATYFFAKGVVAVFTEEKKFAMFYPKMRQALFVRKCKIDTI